MLRRNNSIILARVNRRPTPGVATPPASTSSNNQQQEIKPQQDATPAKNDNSVDWSKAGDAIRKNSGVLFAAANLYGFKTNILSSGMELFGDSAKAKEEAEKKRLKEKEEAEEREWQKALAEAEEQEQKEAEAKKKAEAEKKNDGWGTGLFSKLADKPKQEPSENVKTTVGLASFVFLIVALWYSVSSSFAEARYKEQLRKEILEETKKILREEQENKDKPKSKWFG